MALDWNRIIALSDDGSVNSFGIERIILVTGQKGDKGDKGEPGENAPQWGKITGKLANQLDLSVALIGKANVDDVYTKDETDELLNGVQNLLTFDSTPTEGSTNPVTSGGVYDAITSSGGSGYVLPIASQSTLGGVKVGRNLSIDANGVLSANASGGGGEGGSSSWGNISGTLEDQTDLANALSEKAPKASPTFTGTPKAPTPSVNNNSTQIATTAFVKNAIAASGGGGGSYEIDDTPTGNSTNPVASGGVYSALQLKASVNSPELTGVPKAPTAVAGTNNTQIATTEFVQTAIASGGSGTVSEWGDITGTLSNQTDLQTALNAKAPLASPEFTGTPKAPTAADGTNTTQIATTEFVQNAFKANDAMIFKGTIGSSGATVTALPATHHRGWTYKVATAGTYAGQKCEIGDSIICVTDGTSANNAHWTVLQSNIDGAVTGPASATTAHVATFSGTSGKVIQDSGFTIEKSVPSDAKFSDTTYTGSDGITLTGTNFTNSGVRSVATGSANGTVAVNNNGTTSDIPVKGLKSAAYTESTDYASASSVYTKTQTDDLLDEKADEAIIADYWDNTKKYVSGDVVIYENGLYKYITTVNAPIPGLELYNMRTLSGTGYELSKDEYFKYNNAVYKATRRITGFSTSQISTYLNSGDVVAINVPEYTSGETYEVGDLVKVNDAYYIVTGHESYNEWDSTAVVETTVDELLQERSGTSTLDDVPTANSNNPVKSSGIKTALDGKQNTLTFDSTPTENSTNPVTSDGIYDALAEKADTDDVYTKTESDALFSPVSTSASGNVVTITDGGDNIRLANHVVSFEPTQSGSGTPSSSNIRPITGYSGVTISHSGSDTSNPNTYRVDFIDHETEGNLVTLYSSVGTVGDEFHYSIDNTAKTVRVYGTRYGSTYELELWDKFNYLHNITIPAGRYKFTSLPEEAVGMTVKFTRYGGTTQYTVTNNGIDSGEGFYITTQDTLIGDLSIIVPHKTDNFDVTIHPVLEELTDSYYGGSLDVVNGVLTITKENIASYAGETLSGAWISDRDVYSSGATPTIGAQVVYDLATPKTYNVTPLVLSTSLGVNNFWCNIGSTAIKYYVNLPLYLQKFSSATGGTSSWGNITGTLSDQTDLQIALYSKQSLLTFDTVPTANSTNPVTSGGVYTAIANAGGGSGGSSTWGQISGTLSNQTDLKNALDAKQNILTFDSAPTSNSANPVTSGGVYTAIANAIENKRLTELSGYVLLDVTNFADDITSYILSVEPLQQGSGTPSSSNIRKFEKHNFNISLIQNNSEYSVGLDFSDYAFGIYSKTNQVIYLYGHIDSYNGETLPGVWASDRDVYSAGTTPTIGAEVVYQLQEPIITTSTVNFSSILGILSSNLKECHQTNQPTYLDVCGLGSSGNGSKAYIQLFSSISDKQDALTFDSVPTANSTNPVTSGGVKTALDSKENTIIKTATGAIASFDDGVEAPVARLVTKIEPAQDLHGYDHPWPAGGGKNLWNEKGIGYWAASNGGWTSTVGNSPNYRSTFQFSASLGDQFVVSSANVNLSVCYICEWGNGSWIGSAPVTKSGPVNGRYYYVFTVGSNTDTVAFSLDCRSRENVLTVTDIQLEKGNSVTDYEPYANICPISGWTGVNVTRTGKNLWKFYTNGYVGADGAVYPAGNNARSDYYQISPNTTYTFGTVNNSELVNVGIVFYNAQKTPILPRIQGTKSITATAPANAKYAIASCAISSGTITESICTNYQIQFESGNTFSSYEPYQGDTYSITFPSEAGTVYGGELDVTTGKLTVDKELFTETGYGNWDTNSTNGFTLYHFMPYNITKYAGLSNWLRTASSTDKNGTPNVMFGSNNRHLYVSGITNHVEGITDLASWKAYLSEHPLQLTRPLATPRTYQLTPTEVTTLLGQNNIWADTGDITIDYFRNKELADAMDNTIVDYQKQVINKPDSMITDNIELTSTAAQNYEAGSLAIVQNQLLRITQNIATGGAITIGSNAETIDLETLIAEKAEKILVAKLPYLSTAELYNNTAEFHNTMPRGKDITAYLTDESLWNRINGANGYSLFEDLYVGDYLTAGGQQYMIVDFDYYIRTGDGYDVTPHHLVMMPTGNMSIPEGTVLYGSEDTLTLINTANYRAHTGDDTVTVSSQETAVYKKWNATMNAPGTNTTAGGYKYSRMRQVIMKAADTIVVNAFGSAHINPITVLYPNPADASASGLASNWTWFKDTDWSSDTRRSICDLPNEVQIYGTQAWGRGSAWNNGGYEIGIDKWQFALFKNNRARTNIRANWWLRSVSSSTAACYVINNGYANHYGTSYACGVRPRFLLFG